MAISYEECQAILKQFRQKHRLIEMAEGIHGFRVSIDKGKPIVQIVASSESNARELSESKSAPEQFLYSYAGSEKKAATQIIVRSMWRALFSQVAQPSLASVAGVLVRPGDAAWGDGLVGFGTAGWNIFLNGTLVCVSNWHVLCPRGNDTPIGSGVFLNGVLNASLHTFQRLEPYGNTWDFALARFTSPADAQGAMRACEDGNTKPYPMSLSPSVELGDDAEFFKVGARLPICRTGKLIAVADGPVRYGDGVVRQFVSQLVFSKMSDTGDSGSIIGRASDSTAAGLLFAGGDSETVANPLFRIGWSRTGAVKAGVNLPMFGGTELPTTRGKNVLSLQSGDVPSFDGMLFLKVAIYNDELPGWKEPPPPPIRAEVAVRQILMRVEDVVHPHNSGLMSKDYYYLCFG